MVQTKEDLESWYENEDPWFYRTTIDDHVRREIIIGILKTVCGFSERALDLGAGEGFITEKLPAADISAYDISSTALTRLSPGIRRCESPAGIYGLVVATGVLYQQYDWRLLTDLMHKHASEFILTCSIKEWEVPEAISRIPGKEIFMAEFPYRNEYVQKLRVFHI